MEENKPSKIGFWDFFRVAKDGKLKSTVIVYTFSMSIVFLAVYAAAYWLLTDPIEAWLSARSPLVRNLAESILPALVGTVPCCAVFYIAKNKSFVLYTYLWLVLYALAALVTMLVLLEDGESRLFFMSFFLLIVPAPVLLGTAAAYIQRRLYFRARAETAPEGK